jgi:hypothetical protein
MEVRDLLTDSEFPQRRPRLHDPERELQAFRRLDHVFADSPREGGYSQVLLTQASEELSRLSSIVRQLLSLQFDSARKREP